MAAYHVYVATFERYTGDLKWRRIETPSRSLERAKARAERYLRNWWNVSARIEGPEGLVIYLP